MGDPVKVKSKHFCSSILKIKRPSMATKPHISSAQAVGKVFVRKYYHILHHSPEKMYMFYKDKSTLHRPEEDGSMSTTTTKQGIKEKTLYFKYANCRAEIKSVNAQESINGGVSVLVNGYMTEKKDNNNENENEMRYFSQSFFLAPQKRGYFVLNDILQYVDKKCVPSMEPPSLTCPICMYPLAGAMSTKCGHIFCKVCIKTSIHHQGECPTCRKEISTTDIMRVYLPTTH